MALPAQAPADLEPVHVRHEDVEDHGVRLAVGAQALERLLAVGGELDVVPLELEGASERIANCPLVVDHQDLHSFHCAQSV
jgi:hypothetical protein